MRTPGYDIARALAVLGMVLVNFRGQIELDHEHAAWLQWIGDRLEGKAGALFVILAGVGISLRVHGVGEDFERIRIERRALLERAAILFAAGLLLMHVWEWDILHFYGVFMFLAVPLLWVRSRTLWALAFAAVVVSTFLNTRLDPDPYRTLDSLGDAFSHLVFDGLYPIFPWMAFLLVGMAVGRIDLRDTLVRRRMLALALALALGLEVVDAVARYDQHTGALGLGRLSDWMRTWPRVPRPLFVASCCAIGISVICLCTELAQSRADRRWVGALIATGQLALTLYIAHVLAVLVPVQHGWFTHVPLWAAYVYAFAFYGVAMAFALWWRRRWRFGPFEGLLRQVMYRDEPGPWGAERLRDD